MAFAFNYPNWTELRPGDDFVSSGGHSSYETVRLWTEVERNKLGIGEIVEADPPPPGKVVVKSEIIDQAGVPVRLLTFADAPPATRASAAQCKIALYEAGLLTQVEAAVNAHPYYPVRIWYESASQWERANPYVQGLAAELEIDDETIDGLFRSASLKG